MQGTLAPPLGGTPYRIVVGCVARPRTRFCFFRRPLSGIAERVCRRAAHPALKI
ncbi:hypothetical protein [Kingella potus]|uniref:hypothetical protein n=1 Tax=Kingella potus TaxID=265175 RepID=UPI001FD2FF4D|nr:hypothetical protein [Kingella potus]UOP00647.1 hypothetical protein LVJ84_12685 [Kingella potus]